MLLTIHLTSSCYVNVIKLLQLLTAGHSNLHDVELYISNASECVVSVYRDGWTL